MPDDWMECAEEIWEAINEYGDQIYQLMTYEGGMLSIGKEIRTKIASIIARHAKARDERAEKALRLAAKFASEMVDWGGLCPDECYGKCQGNGGEACAGDNRDDCWVVYWTKEAGE